jgi:hypothetical protein
LGLNLEQMGLHQHKLGLNQQNGDFHQQRKCQKRRLEYQQNTISMCNHTIVNPEKTDEWFVNAWYCFQQFLSFLWNMYSNPTKLEEDWFGSSLGLSPCRVDGNCTRRCDLEDQHPWNPKGVETPSGNPPDSDRSLWTGVNFYNLIYIRSNLHFLGVTLW